MAGTYAADTDVPVSRSRDELERTLERYDATGFAYGKKNDRAVVQFEMRDRRVRITLPLPDPRDDGFWKTPTGLGRTEKSAAKLYEQEVRRRWRALNLVVKAKLVAIASGIATFDDEWLAYFVLPDGTTIGEKIEPQLPHTLVSGGLPPLLPGGKD